MSGANTAQPTFTPSAAGIYTFELMVGDGALIAKDQVVITVIGSGISLPGRIEAENYKAGGENVGYHDLTSGNTGGAYNPNDNVDIEATSDIGGGYNVGWIDANEWLAYDVNIQSAGTYKFTARMASANAGTKTITITVDGNPLTTISSTTSSGWQAWTDAVSANVSLTSGNHVIRFSFSGGFNLNYVDVASVAPNPGALQFSAAAYSVNENGSSVSITVSRVNGSEGSVTVNYATTNGTATAGADYSTTNGTLTFAAGVTSQTFSVPIIDDQSVEGNETVNLTLSNPTGGATLGSPVSAVLTIADNDQSGIALPGRIQAEDYMSGGEGVGYHDLTSGNTGGDYKPSDNVDIEATTDMGGGYNVGWIDASEWLSYNVNVAATGAYSLTARLASGNAGTKTLTMTVDGTTVGTFNFTDASGWQSWNNIVVSNVNLTAGSHVVRLIATTGGFNLNYIDVATQGNIAPIAYAGPDFSAAKNTVVTLDGYNSTDPDNAPSPLTYAWSQVSGPTVSINAPVHARVTCTPTVAGIYVFRLTVSDGAATSYDDVTVTVSEETNLLANGDFTNGLTGWTSLFLENATGSITNDANSAKIAITALGPNPWDVQLFQSISLTANKTYTLEFDMKAATTPKSFKIVIEHDGGSYTKYHEQQYSVTSAANTYQHFVITFIPNATDTQVKLGFHLGTFNTSSVWIDNVVLK
ncbi:MAG TPA: carbohydrate-binding protein [Armatimonadota bacterium]|nr:carbohydrate-binding protein [Armatimonadota bacterium]